MPSIISVAPLTHDGGCTGSNLGRGPGGRQVPWAGRGAQVPVQRSRRSGTSKIAHTPTACCSSRGQPLPSHSVIGLQARSAHTCRHSATVASLMRSDLACAAYAAPIKLTRHICSSRVQYSPRVAHHAARRRMFRRTRLWRHLSRRNRARWPIRGHYSLAPGVGLVPLESRSLSGSHAPLPTPSQEKRPMNTRMHLKHQTRIYPFTPIGVKCPMWPSSSVPSIPIAHPIRVKDNVNVG